VLVLSGCAAPPVVSTDRQQMQLATLENIATLERDAARFAASCESVCEAEVYIRANNAVVILSTAQNARVSADVIAQINAYIAERTGLAGDRIVIKTRSAPMRGTTP
jgi:hypothetical protein